jgi:nucleoid DNA-binding protein
MWNMKCFLMPVIIGATVIVCNSLQKYLETIAGQHSIDSSQNTAILGTWHIIRKVLQGETWSLSGGVHHWLKSRSTREERNPVTRNNININNNNNNFLTSVLCTQKLVIMHTSKAVPLWTLPQDKHILTVRAHRAFCETLCAWTTSDRETHQSFNLSQDGSALHYERLVFAEL